MGRLSEIELKPCPMCGSQPKLKVCKHGGKQYDYAEVYCTQCGVNIRKDIDVEYSAKDEAMRIWNERK